MQRASLTQRLREQANTRCRLNLQRQRVCITDYAERRLQTEHGNYLNFTANDYLGLRGHPELRARFRDAAARWGFGSTGSALVSGFSQAHQNLEVALAEHLGCDRALLFSTGYMANLAVISSLLSSADLVVQDKLNHASLIDAAILSGAKHRRYRHLDYASAERSLNGDSKRAALLVSEGIFSMDGDRADLATLAGIAHANGAWLMVDDAHGFGVFGTAGQGSAEKIMSNCDIYVATFGKACGGFGAFVAGSEALIEHLLNHARSYLFTTALPPAIAAANQAALELVQQADQQREQLFQRVRQYRAGAEQLGIPLSRNQAPIQPLLLGSAEQALAVSHSLAKQNILISAIRPPTVPVGSARLRITFSAAHTEQDVERLLSALEQCLNL